MSAASTPPNHERYVDFDEYVEFQLDKTRKSIKSNDLLAAAAGAVALLLGLLLLFVMLDHWVIDGGFSVAARWCWFLLLIGVCGGWIAWKLVRPLLRRVNRLFAAKELEEASPALRSNLLNWVDLRDAGRAVHPSVMQTIEKRAATQLSKIDVAQAVDHRPLLTASYALLAILMLFCGYALFSPKKISTALWRVFPFARAVAVTRTEIREVVPGDATLLLRGRMDVSVVVAGEIPESVQFLYTTVDGRIQDEAVLLRPESAGTTRFRGLFAGENGTGVLQDFSYVIIAGDAHSPRYHVTVHQPPSAAVNQVSLRFPAYMKLEDAVSTGGNIDGWEGAEAVILAKSDKPTKSAVLQFLEDPQSPPTGEEIPVTVSDDTNLQATWKLDFRADGTFPKHYRIQCRNEAGEVDPSPVSYAITIRPDRPPEVALLYPERDLEAPANAVIPLLVQASDPDFELGYVNLHAEKGGQSILREPLSEGRQQQVTVKHNLELEPLHLKPGEEIEFWVEAFDNKQPRRNRKNTPRLKIRIEQPVSKQQAAEQLAEEQQQRDQRMADAKEEQERRDAAQSPEENRDAERKPAERDKQEQESAEQNSDKAEQSGDASSQKGGTDSSQPGDKEQRSRSSSQAGGNASGDSGGESASEQPAETPLSPDGEDDAEALQRLNDQLNPDRQQPPENSRGAEEQQETRPQPTPQSKGSEEGNDRSGGGGAGEQNKSKTEADREDSSPGDAPQPKPEGESGASEKGRDAKKSNPAESKNSASEPQQDGEPASQSTGRDETGKLQDKPQRPGNQGKSKDKNGADQKPGPADKDAADQGPEEAAGDDRQPMKTSDGPDQKGAAPDQPGKTSPQPAGKKSGSQDSAGENAGTSSDSHEDESSAAGGKPQNTPGKKNTPKNAGASKSDPAKSGKNNPEPGGDQSDGDSSATEEKGDTNSGDEKTNRPSSSSSDGERSKEGMKSRQKNSAGGESGKDQESAEKEAGGSKADRGANGSENRRPGKGSDSAEEPQPSPSRSSQRNPNAKKTEGKNDRDVENSDEPAPQGNQNRDGDPNAADEEMKGPGRKGGQRSEQPQGGEAGGSKQDKQGNSGSQTKGPGEKSNTPGKESAADEATDQPDAEQRPGKGSQAAKEGQAGSKPGGKQDGENGETPPGGKSGEPTDAQSGSESGKGSESSPSSAGKSGEGKSGEGKSGEGKSGDKPSDQAGGKAGSSGSKPGNAQGGNPTENDGAGGHGNGTAGGEAGETASTPDEANLEYNRQAAELVLQRVRDDLNNDRVDPKLLEELGWDADQLKRFTDRLAKELEKPAGELTPQDEARRRQFEEMLKHLDLKSSGAKRAGGNSPNREIDQSGVRRAPVPQDYKASWEAFTRSLSKSNRPAPKVPDAASKRR